MNYYLFYASDANDTISELNESDNMGSFKIIFNDLISVPTLSQEGLTAFVSNHQLLIQSNGIDNGKDLPFVL